MDLAAFESCKPHFDRGASRFKEVLWYAAKTLFFLTALPFPSRFKCALLRLFGARIGRGVVIHPRVNIKFPWRLQIGDHSWIGEEAILLSLAPIEIGPHCCLSQRAFLCTGSHNADRESFDLIVQPIRIERECWIAAQAFIGPGVSIGPRCVIGAGSVVTRNVPAESFVTGNPGEAKPRRPQSAPQL